MFGESEGQKAAAPTPGPAPPPHHHEPVMLDEAMGFLAPRQGGTYCDATVGLGGHASEILERSQPDGRLLGIDRDASALALAAQRLARFGERVSLAQAPFSTVGDVLERMGVSRIDGLLLDLGVSSLQLDTAERGFSFRLPGPLDMRMDRSAGETAAELINRLDESDLSTILHEFGEERFAARIARTVVKARSAGALRSTTDLAALVASSVPARRGGRGRDPATRTFQALRLAVNHELEELDALLTRLPDCLSPGARVVVIAFHSLEDRIAKRRLRELSGRYEGGAAGRSVGFRLLTKRAVFPGRTEVVRNPRARSARLRAVERIE